jgi:hypothetical protein
MDELRHRLRTTSGKSPTKRIHHPLPCWLNLGLVVGILLPRVACAAMPRLALDPEFTRSIEDLTGRDVGTWVWRSEFFRLNHPGEKSAHAASEIGWPPPETTTVIFLPIMTSLATIGPRSLFRQALPAGQRAGFAEYEIPRCFVSGKLAQESTPSATISTRPDQSRAVMG